MSGRRLHRRWQPPSAPLLIGLIAAPFAAGVVAVAIERLIGLRIDALFVLLSVSLVAAGGMVQDMCESDWRLAAGLGIVYLAVFALLLICHAPVSAAFSAVKPSDPPPSCQAAIEGKPCKPSSE